MKYKTFEQLFEDAVQKGILKAGVTFSDKNSVRQGFKVYFDAWLQEKFGKDAIAPQNYLNYLTFENLLLHERSRVEKRIAFDLENNLEYEKSQEFITKLGHPFFAYIATQGIVGKDLEKYFETLYGNENEKERFLIEIDLMNSQRLARAKQRLSSQPNAEYVISKHDYLSEWIKSKKAELNRKEKKNDNVEHKSYQSFDDLFNNIQEARHSVDALRKVHPSIINEQGAYCLGPHSKGSIVAFVAVLKTRGKIQNLNDEEMAVLLNKKIPNLEITGKTLRSPGTKFYKKYINELLVLIK